MKTIEHHPIFSVYPLGSTVKPFSKLKRSYSSWSVGFCQRTYSIIAHDYLDREPVLILDDGSVVYPDEVKLISL